MATNRDVATRFASVIKHKSIMQGATFNPPLMRPLKGSNFRVEASTERYDALRRATHDLFIPLVQAISYTTTVAEIVWNNHSQLPELWVDPKKYSDSTQRQVGYLRRAFYDQLIDAGFFDDTQADRMQSYAQCFETKAAHNHYPNIHCRVTNTVHRETIDHTLSRLIHTNLAKIDTPKLHDHTRRRAVSDALHTAQYGLKLISQDVPDGYGGLSAVTLRQELQSYIDMFNNLNHIEDINDLRLAVRGIRALERE